ncbi:MAG TPA: hypothetical protein VD998_02580 [Verrucomicrobiae bacterium]|nr:hypothetical protein [Verrucomicrobiae bacterium]
MPNTGIDEQLTRVAQQEEDRRQLLEQAQQEDRRAQGDGSGGRIQGIKDAARDKAKAAVKQKAKQKFEKEIAKKVAQTAVRRGALSLLLSWPALIVGAIILGIIILIGLFMIFYSSYGAICRAVLPTIIANYTCPAGTENPPQTPLVPNRPVTADEQWVNLSAIGIPYSGIVAPNLPRVRQSIATMLQRFQAIVQASGSSTQWVVTSAWRAGNATSCHNLGEAVDIGIRPPPTPVTVNGRVQLNNAGRPLYNDPRINELMTYANAAGFRFILDEYNYPTGNATGGHIHMSIGGYNYCVDNDA